MSITEDLNQADKEVLIEQAVKWWSMLCPQDWSVEQHLSHPTVNCTTEADENLARATADVVRRRHQGEVK